MRCAVCVVRVRRGGQCEQDKPPLYPTTVRIITTGTVALLFKPVPPAPIPNALRTTHFALHSLESCTTEEALQFLCYYSSTSCFFRKIFKKQIRKLLTLNLFLISEKIFEFFEFRSSRSFAHVGCRRQPASSLSMRLAVKLLQSRRDGTMSNPR